MTGRVPGRLIKSLQEQRVKRVDNISYELLQLFEAIACLGTGNSKGDQVDCARKSFGMEVLHHCRTPKGLRNCEQFF